MIIQPRKEHPLSTPIAEVVWSETTIPSNPEEGYSCDTLWTAWTEGGHRLTVLDRETGFGGYGLRDIESGLLHAETGFWLASGMRDVRSAPDVKTVGDAIEWIQEHANNCRGG